MLIVGITGKKRVGKNYVADLAQRELEATGLKVKQLGFADPLKAVCKILFGITDEMLSGDKTELTRERCEDLVRAQHEEEFSMCPADPEYCWKYKGGNLSVREVLQLVGTDLFRNCWSPTIWTRHMQHRLYEARAECYDAVFITDCRFENEAEVIRDAGGSMWHVKGPSRGKDGSAEAATAGHVSEAGVTEHYMDYRIWNEGDQAREAVAVALATALKGR